MKKDNLKNNKALIITGCIKPVNQKHLKITNCNERLKQYLDSVLFYINKSSYGIIIFCENSNYEYDYQWLEEEAIKNKKEFEWISFQGDTSLIEENGKGVGEGEILKYAIDRSKYQFDYIEKVTGRLIVKNIDQIENRIDYKNTYYNKDLYLFINEKAMDTRLFFCKREVLEEQILNLYKKSDDKNNNIEKLIANNINHIKCLPRYPIFKGKSGGFGFEYGDESPIRKRLLSFLCITGLFNKSLSIKSVRKICSILKKW